MADSWQEYQEEVAGFFRSLGLNARTNYAIKGARTSHDIDVFVESHYSGFDVIWIIECKHWKTRVTKLHVLALREIVLDVGADKGILLAESGFQSGAVEAATLTNVHVTSLLSLRSTASADIVAMRLRELFDRVQACKERYWEIPKEKRIDCGLRPDVGDHGYSANIVIELANQILVKAFRGSYPMKIDSMEAFATFDGPREFHTPTEILPIVEPMIAELEAKLVACDESS
jgi:hypothetical protein